LCAALGYETPACNFGVGHVSNHLVKR
jgi:hypothetical protein